MTRITCIITTLLLWCCSFSLAEAPKRILLLGQGPDGHPPTTHEFMAGVRIMEHLLAKYPNTKVIVAKADEPWPEGPELIDQADGVVLFLTQGGRWMRQDPERYQALGRLAERGGGIVALHWAVGAKDAEYIEPCLRFLGGCHGGPDRKYVKQEGMLRPGDHPIAMGFEPMKIYDEFYYSLKFTPRSPSVDSVLVTEIDGKDETVAWAWQRPDGGRSFGYVGLHFHKNWQEEQYRRLVVQAILWTNKLPIPASGVEVDCPDKIFELPKTTASSEK